MDYRLKQKMTNSSVLHNHKVLMR